MRLVLTMSVIDRAVALVEAAQQRGKNVEKLVFDPREMEEALNCVIGEEKDPEAQAFFKDRELYVRGPNGPVQIVCEPVLPRVKELA